MKLRDIMKPQPITVSDVTTLGEAHRVMMRNQIRHLPVLADGGRLCGILSERDVLEYRAKTAFREDWWRAPVAVAMVPHPQTAHPDDSLTEAEGRMAMAKIGALPIVETGALVGLVTVTDVLAADVAQAMR
jgi:acetoin utilization protein AcuB